MSATSDEYHCRICLKEFSDKTALIEHLRADHEPLEVESYVATSWVMEEDRDKVAREFFRQLERIRSELKGEEYAPCPKCGRWVRSVKNSIGKWIMVNEDNSPHEHS